MIKDDTSVCPVEIAGGLDNSIRRFLQNPQKILKDYITEDMTVLDLGCGPGFFSVEIAKMLSNPGKVIAADLQEGMLKKVENKIAGTELESKIRIHKCEQDKVGITEKVDFILAFYMIHEVPDKEKLFAELHSVLKPEGKFYIIEPNFHVSKNSFYSMIDKLETAGFEITDEPKLFLSRAVLLMKKKQEETGG